MISFNLNKPYPLNDSIKGRWINCISFGGFVFLFLFVFKPFNLSSLRYNIFLTSLGYGLVCFFIMAILNIAYYSAMPVYFSESSWSVKRELLWSLLNVFLIGLANFFYSFTIGIASFSMLTLLLFLTYTMAIGVFPITAVVLINQARLNNKFKGESLLINALVENSVKEIPPTQNLAIKILSENGSVELELLPEDLLFAKSDDNYVEIVFFHNGKKSRKLIRNTLKNIHAMFPDHQDFYRCHKSYVVNLIRVNHISGNAQGYKLHLKDTDEIVPVSRSNNENIKLLFAQRP